MSYLDANMNYIRERGFIVNSCALADLTVQASVEFSTARDGGKTFALTRDNRKITFHSPYKPMDEAVRLVEKIQCDRVPDLVIVYGLGLGYHLSALRTRFGSRTRILVVEPDPGLLGRILEQVDLARVFDDSMWLVCTGETSVPIQQVGALFKLGINDKVLFAEHPVYVREYRSYFDNLTEEIKKYGNNQLINLATTIYFNETWLSNSLCNLPYFYRHPGVKILENTFRDYPAIIVSAGPSLDKNIDLLQEAKNKALIISVGTAAKALLAKNISPDLVVTIDAGAPNFDHFRGIDISDIPLVFDSIVYPEILTHHKGKKFVVNIGTKIAYWLEKCTGEKGRLDTGGSVANIAFGLAVLTGADPIVMVGQDLSYAGKKTHATGSAFYYKKVKDDFEDNPNFLRVPGYYGDEVWTSRTLYNFLNWFEEAVKLTPGRTVINATEGGARIRGTMQLPLRQVIDRYCLKNRDFGQELSGLWADFIPQGQDELQRALEDMASRLKKLELICTEGRTAAVAALRHLVAEGNQSPALGGLFKRMDRADKQLKREQEITAFMDEALQAVTLSVLNRHRDIQESGKRDMQGLVELSLSLYDNIGKTCARFAGYFLETAKKLRKEDVV